MHSATGESRFAHLARSLRLSLLGAALAGLGLLASLHGVPLLAWLWAVVLFACVGFGMLSLSRLLTCHAAGQAGVSTPTHTIPSAPPAVAVPENVSTDHAVGMGASSERCREEARFLSSAGHDLRQPLQAISLFSATLAAHALPAESAKLVSGIEKAAASLSDLFEAVMAVARLAAGRVEFESRSVALDGLLVRCVMERSDEAEDKDLHLRHVSTRLRVLGDETQLARALDKLIAHALETTEQGGIVVGCRWRGGRVRIEVWDSGLAIPAGAQGELFTPFAPYGQRLQDRGLGLVLASRMVAAMGGEVTARADLKRGKVLAISLPCA